MMRSRARGPAYAAMITSLGFALTGCSVRAFA